MLTIFKRKKAAIALGNVLLFYLKRGFE